MMKKWMAMILALALAVPMTACGEGEETTVSGMVTKVEGTVISVVEMDVNAIDKGSTRGERPQMPENGEMPEGFDPGSFAGSGENEERPQRPENGEMPEGFDPGSFAGFGENGERPQMPENGEMPEGFDPESIDGSFPGWDGSGERPQHPADENGEGGRGFGGFDFEGETTDIDIADAHISVERDGVKESGTMNDVAPGTYVTVTMTSKGKVTNVLVSQMSGFGGRRTSGSGS